MNTVESLIKDELGRTIVDLAVREIKSWAKAELNYLRYALDYKVVIPINKKTYAIGNYVIIFKDKKNYFLKKENKLIHNFYNKKAAILYVIFEKTRKYNLARDILEKDKTVSNYYYNLNFFKDKLTQKSINFFKKDLYMSRYLESNAQYNHALKDLEKSISNAKYMKVWDRIL
jgi:hypothetical protein